MDYKVIRNTAGGGKSLRKLHRRCDRRLLCAVAHGKSFLSGTTAGRAKIPFASPAVPFQSRRTERTLRKTSTRRDRLMPSEKTIDRNS